MIGGNFNGDSVIDGLDFILWNAFKFTSSMDAGAGIAAEANAGEWAQREIPGRLGKDSLASEMIMIPVPSAASALEDSVPAIGADLSQALLGDGTGVIVGQSLFTRRCRS